MIGLIARKEGMSRVFTDEGKSVPVTVLKIHSNVVSQIKTSAIRRIREQLKKDN